MSDNDDRNANSKNRNSNDFLSFQLQELMHGRHWFPIELDMVGTTLNSNINDGLQV